MFECGDDIVNLKFSFSSAPRSAEIQLKFVSFWIILYGKTVSNCYLIPCEPMTSLARTTLKALSNMSAGSVKSRIACNALLEDMGRVAFITPTGQEP